MTGVFDSGVGGLCAYRELRRLCPEENLIYLADNEHAPYGTKTKDEILHLTKNNIRLLTDMGADRVLIACCSASSLYHLLDEWEREVSIPIISPAAEMVTMDSRIAVIATRHTVNISAFGTEIHKICDATVCEMAEQELVRLVELGARDGRISAECATELDRIADRVRRFCANSLILGCTHFSHLEGELAERLPDVKIISPAREGARAMSHRLGGTLPEEGKNIYLTTKTKRIRPVRLNSEI